MLEISQAWQRRKTPEGDSRLANSEQKQSVIKSAASMSLGTMASRVLGYVRDAVLMAAFSRTVTDAYIIAFRLPNLVRRLLGEGSLTVSFLPVYVDQLSHDESGERARRLSNSVYTLLCLVTMTISVLAFIFMRPLLELWVGNEGGFASVPGKLDLTVTLSRIMIAYVFLVTQFSFFSGVCNAFGKFFAPAFAPALFNGAMIIFIWLPDPSTNGEMAAWGVVVGGILQSAMLAIILYRIGHLPRLTMKINVTGLKTVLLNLGPGMAGLGVFQLMTIANTSFAARLPEGTQTYLYNSDRILELPQSIVAISLGTALLPTFSRLLSQGRREEMLKAANEGLRSMLFLALPSAVGMALLAGPMIEVLFQRGAFGAADVAVTARVIQIYSVLLIASSLAKVTVPGFYALKNTWLPAVLALGVLLVHLVLANYLVDTYGIDGLAWATTISGTLNMIGLQICFYFFLGPVGLMKVLGAVMRMLPGLIAMGALIFWLSHLIWIQNDFASGQLMKALALAVIIGAAIVVYFGVAALCGSDEARRTLGILKRRLGRAK